MPEVVKSIVVAALMIAVVGVAIWQGVRGQRKPWRRWTHVPAVLAVPAVITFVVVVLGAVEASRERRSAESQGMVYIEREGTQERWASPDGKTTVSFPGRPAPSEVAPVFAALALWSAAPWAASRIAARWIIGRRKARTGASSPPTG